MINYMFTVADTGCAAQISLMKDVLLLTVSRRPFGCLPSGASLKDHAPLQDQPTSSDLQGVMKAWLSQCI